MEESKRILRKMKITYGRTKIRRKELGICSNVRCEKGYYDTEANNLCDYCLKRIEIDQKDIQIVQCELCDSIWNIRKKLKNDESIVNENCPNCIDELKLRKNKK